MRMVSALDLRLLLLAAATGILLAGCSTAHYREQADEEVYDIITYKKQAALNDDAAFTIEEEAFAPLEALPRRRQPLVPGAEKVTLSDDDRVPAIVSARAALDIAIRNSRDYQQQKESVYLSALELTAERDDWSPTFAALLSGDYRRVGDDELWAADTSFGISQLLATGAEVSLRVTSAFLEYTTGAPRTSAASALAFDFIQPLWRGAGRAVAQESLTQAERDVVYQLRSFARFHKSFAVDIVTSYYNILQQRAQLRNQWNNFVRLRIARERAEAMAEAGRVPEFEVDQAQQDELRAHDRFIRALQQYRQLLDSFKLQLALPTEALIDVDESDLDRLTQLGLIHPEMSQEEAVQFGLRHRLDLMTSLDQVADAGRKVDVAANGLGPDVDLVLSADVSTDGTKPGRFRFSEGTYRAGLDLDLPLDRTDERNTYRRALINLDRAARDADELTDRVALQVRQAWRNLQEARESYVIQQRSLELAQRRVDSTTLLQRAGRATTRDLLESEAALLEAQNALISVIVDHNVARMQLWRDIGTLTVTPDRMISGGEPDSETREE